MSIMLQMILCVCLFVIGVVSSGKALSRFISGDLQLDIISISIELIVQIGVLTYFVFKYRKSVYYPDAHHFFIKGFMKKYLLAILYSVLVWIVWEIFSGHKVMVFVPVWIYASISVLCIVIYFVMVFFLFVPKQYVFQWKMKLGDVDIRKVMNDGMLQEDGCKMIKIEHEESGFRFYIQKECETDGELEYAYELIGDEDGIEGNYWTSDTLESLYEARCKAVRYLREDGINITLNDLKYVSRQKM